MEKDSQKTYCCANCGYYFDIHHGKFHNDEDGGVCEVCENAAKVAYERNIGIKKTNPHKMIKENDKFIWYETEKGLGYVVPKDTFFVLTTEEEVNNSKKLLEIIKNSIK